jgi:maleamate amidohydrolase
VDVSTPFGGGLGWGDRPALVLIDMMRAYFTPGSPFDLGSPAAVEGCATLLASARAAGIPVLHTRVRYNDDLSDGGLFVRKVPALAALVDGNALGEFVPALEPAPGEVVVVKQYASAFFGTSLAATLTAKGIDTTVIAGVSTSGCVRASATDAMQHGFRPVVAADACGDRTAAVHDANLFDLQAKYADVTTVAEVVARFAAVSGR